MDGVQVFSATKARERDELGDKVTYWVQHNPDKQVIETHVRLSSDSAFHCLSFVLLWKYVSVT
jgi:hypothetical protein